MSGPTAGDPIFEDLGGRRFRRLKRWGRAAFLIFAAWAVAMAVVVLAPGMDPAGDAALRDMDHAGVDLIVVEALPEAAEWTAVADRLRRAVAGAGQG